MRPFIVQALRAKNIPRYPHAPLYMPTGLNHTIKRKMEVTEAQHFMQKYLVIFDQVLLHN